MKITKKHTIADVLQSNRCLFGLGANPITEEIKRLPAADCVGIKKCGVVWSKINTRSVSGITVGELNVLNTRAPSEEYFINTLGVMLGLIRFSNVLPNGKPDWLGGWESDKESVMNLGFIRAFRYFIQIQDELEAISRKWQKLGAWRKKRPPKRPDRGIVSVNRQYCQLMNGAVKFEDVWNIPWAVVYEAFENCDLDNKEQSEAYEAAKNKTRTKK